jgi:hypothetical protein
VLGAVRMLAGIVLGLATVPNADVTKPIDRSGVAA